MMFVLTSWETRYVRNAFDNGQALHLSDNARHVAMRLAPSSNIARRGDTKIKVWPRRRPFHVCAILVP